MGAKGKLSLVGETHKTLPTKSMAKSKSGYLEQKVSDDCKITLNKEDVILSWLGDE